MKHFSIALVCFLGWLTGSASGYSVEPWEDPDFLARFTATYGVRGDREPEVTREEQNALLEAAAHMPGDPAAALAALERRARPESSAALDFTLGNLRFQLEQLREAEGHYREAIRKFPDFLRAHKNLGLTLARDDRFAEALVALTRALTLGSADGDTYGLIAFSHLQREHWVSSEAAYRQALLFEPENLNWQVGLARTLQAQERHVEAGALLAELISRRPDRADYWLYQVNTYIALNEPVKAATNLELVRRMGGIGPESLLLLGDIYSNDDLPQLALGAYEEAFAAGVRVPFGRARRAAERLIQRGHVAEAGRLLERIEDSAGELSPRETGELRRLQGRLAAATGEGEAAARFLEAALEANPLDGESLLLLAELIGAEDLERAELLLEQAARLPETVVPALRQRGELLVRAGRYGEALAPLREAEAMQPREALRLYIERVERLAEATREAR